MASGVDAVDFDLHTDAAESFSFGVFCRGSWCAGRWADSWTKRGRVRNLALLELFQILVDVVVWGRHFLELESLF